jgi:ketosteroid isomerase-like protein
MTHEELAHRAYEAYNAGDLDALLEFCTPDITLERASPGPPVRGQEALRQFSGPDAFEWQTLTPEGFVERGDRLLVSITARARGRGSGIELVERAFHVVTIQDGKVARIEVYFNEADAHEALHRARPRPSSPSARSRRQ